MSIEYTIDIQLTELGYSDLLQPQESSGRGQQPVEGKEAGAKQTSDTEQQQQQQQHGAQSLQEEEAVKGRGSVPTVSAGQDSSREDGDSAEMQQDVEDDSDDSEVSETFEEEEIDEEDDDDEGEDGINNESSLSGDYPCSVCDLQLPSKFKLQDHMNLHTGARPYCCAECGKRFCQIYNYRVHLRTHAQSQVDRPTCRICLRTFASQEDLTIHLSRTHFENEFYECDLCKRVFASLKECEYHVQLHKCKRDVVCEVCGRSFSSQKSLTRHRKKTCRRIFKCTDCSKTFINKNGLLKHSFSHLGLLPYTCVRCRCHFRLAKLYRLHKCEPERIHCVACLREFLSEQDFQQHKKDTGCWGNQEPKGDEIRCLECGQRFDTTEELKKHAGAHQRVLKCAECGKGFRSALLLMSHMGGHAGKSPCLCQSCGLGFPHQQNYDSHRKTCGQTPKPPVSNSKKRQASKSSSSSSSEPKKVNAKPDSSSEATNKAAEPAVSLNQPAEPVTDPPGPEPAAAGGVPAGSAPSDGLWKLTLDKRPPPGVKLVVFLPVCATQSNGLPLPSAVSPTLSASTMQVQPQETFPPVLKEHLGGNAPLDAPLNLVTGIKHDPELEVPLDLSKKCNSSNCNILRIKSEPGEFEISEEANSTERPEFKNDSSKALLKADPEETNRSITDPIDLSSCSINTRSSGLLTDIKREPQPPDIDPLLNRSRQLPEREIKMEVDVPQPADVEN
ncbi:oocyte zinc finger protein XlCOF28 [Centropristis striata]|uniref:oocyte zinc finger protein XlCOF28 n=1 Tax=Centropristis striata TaxID=184440 RepID=UPI0027DF8691|nr:oocyte zinc finger protein XlCOF28 [Centropristis striata]